MTINTCDSLWRSEWLGETNSHDERAEFLTRCILRRFLATFDFLLAKTPPLRCDTWLLAQICGEWDAWVELSRLYHSRGDNKMENGCWGFVEAPRSSIRGKKQLPSCWGAWKSFWDNFCWSKVISWDFKQVAALGWSRGRTMGSKLRKVHLKCSGLVIRYVHSGVRLRPNEVHILDFDWFELYTTALRHSRQDKCI